VNESRRMAARHRASTDSRQRSDSSQDFWPGLHLSRFDGEARHGVDTATDRDFTRAHQRADPGPGDVGRE
jgi:hypothetical protein